MAQGPLALLLVRKAPLAVIREALVRLLSRDDYRPFDPAAIPPHYPALAGEFEHWLAGQDPFSGEVLLVPSSWDRAFARAQDLSRLLPESLLVSLLEPPAAPLRLKAWQAGEVRLKVGEDPDEELFYHPLPSAAEKVQEFLHEWGAGPSPRSGIPPDPEAVSRALGVPSPRPPFPEVLRRPEALGRGALERWTFIDRRSRLAQET